MKKMQSGFTLIELVIVITVIAILAAIALPKYIAIQRDARVSKMQGIYGSIRTAAALAKARCELDLAGVAGVGTCTANGGTANMDGTAVTMLNRYPTADAAGIVVAASIDSTNDSLTIGGAGPITFSPTGAADTATCVITYNAAVAGPPIVAPVISLVTTGC